MMFNKDPLGHEERNTQALVFQLEELSTLTINLLLEAREQINVLEKLTNKYPDNKKIKLNKQICAQAIHFGEEMISKNVGELQFIAEKQAQASLFSH